MSGSTTSRADRSISVISLLVAVLAVLLSIVVVYNGSTRQAGFEATRTRCLDAFYAFSEDLILLEVTGKFDAEFTARYNTNRVRVYTSCGGTLIPLESKYWATFEEYITLLAQVRATLVDEPDDAAAIEGTGTVLANGFTDLIQEGAYSVVEMSGPSVWPWDAVTSADPSIPAGAPTPSATP
jgi:hypothetical protein